MKKIHLFIGLCIWSLSMWAQPNVLPEKAYKLYPTLNEMTGFAVGHYKEQIIIIGGSIKSEVPEIYAEAFPNTEILLIDLENERASAYSNTALEGTIGEQMSATKFQYGQWEGLLYIIGGYGFSESIGQFITFPNLTIIDLPLFIDALQNGQNPSNFMEQICDENLAVFAGIFDRNKNEYYLINGKKAKKLKPFEEEPEYFEEDYFGLSRVFQLERCEGELRLFNYREEYDQELFFKNYKDQLPKKIKQALKLFWGEEESH